MGEDYERITLQCQTGTPVLAAPKWVGGSWSMVDQILPHFHGLTATEKPEHLTFKLVQVETWRKNTEMTINVTTNGLDDPLWNFICPGRPGSPASPRQLKTSSLIMHHK